MTARPKESDKKTFRHSTKILCWSEHLDRSPPQNSCLAKSFGRESGISHGKRAKNCEPGGKISPIVHRIRAIRFYCYFYLASNRSNSKPFPLEQGLLGSVYRIAAKK